MQRGVRSPGARSGAGSLLLLSLLMATADQSSATLAILIDADNASPAIVKGLIDEVARFGRATVRRIYGNWTEPNLKSWKDALLDNSIQPMQQFANTKGKNSTDSALIIDAMDLLYAGNVDGFCIVSSDSDFTRLASRLRESGKWVYGFGEKKTPSAFVRACDRFIYTEVFTQVEGEAPHRKTSAAELDGDRDFLELVAGAVDDASDDSGWAHLGAVGSNLTKKKPGLRFTQLRLFEAQRPARGIEALRGAAHGQDGVGQTREVAAAAPAVMTSSAPATGTPVDCIPCLSRSRLMSLIMIRAHHGHGGRRLARIATSAP